MNPAQEKKEPSIPPAQPPMSPPPVPGNNPMEIKGPADAHIATGNQPYQAIPQPSAVHVTIPATKPPPKFPFMIITAFLIVVIIGFGGSFAYFSITNNQTEEKKPVAIHITPPATIHPTKVTVLSSPSGELTPKTSSQSATDELTTQN